jgi:hypothetical protein
MMAAKTTPAQQPAEKTASAQQQPVISIRISEALRYRLEHLKKVLFLKSGESVSTSEVAKQLLESSRDDRLDFVKLLSDPKKSLLNARRKVESRLPLSQTEWMVVAYFCQLGAEAFAENVHNQVSYESLVGILEAFLAVYGLQNAKRTPRDPYYVGNLPLDEEVVKKGSRSIGCEDVRRVVEKTIQALRNPMPQQWKPIHAARNLFFALDETEFPNIETLNEVLWPYWPILWRVCARGHYFDQGKPLVEETSADQVYDPFVEPPLPLFEEGECSIALPRGRQGGFALCLVLPGKLAPTYPMSEFAMISEFRAMLGRFDSEHDRSVWRGYYFFAHATKLDDGEISIVFRGNDNGITFHLERSVWLTLRNLLRRAWEHPEVRRLWDEEVLRYGEL